MAVRRGTRRYRKGSKSKTMKGRKDFTTKKGSKYFDRKGHRSRHAKDSKKKRKPYSRRVRRGGVGSVPAGHRPPAHPDVKGHHFAPNPQSHTGSH